MTTTIYRFKLSDDITEIVTHFAKIHQHDERKQYKESWKKWCDDNENMIYRETTRLSDLGYQGDVISKMYKAGRYYFRNKNINEEKKPKKRRQYISMDSDILEAMDDHIKTCSNNEDYSPALGYDDFCKKNINILKDEITRICESITDIKPATLSSKFKKTYKNRYYLFTKSKTNTKK